MMHAGKFVFLAAVAGAFTARPAPTRHGLSAREIHFRVRPRAWRCSLAKFRD
jgi:hypothetical protein